MFCKECGCKLDDGSDFCPNCGKKIERSAERTQAEDISIMKTADEKSVAITANDENRAQPADARKIEPKGVNGLSHSGLRSFVVVARFRIFLRDSLRYRAYFKRGLHGDA